MRQIKVPMRSTIIVDKQITSIANSRNKICSMISNRKARITLGKCSGSRTTGVVVVHVADGEVADVGEEVVVGEVVAASSRASALPKNLIAHLPYRIMRGGVPEAYCPS